MASPSSSTSPSTSMEMEEDSFEDAPDAIPSERQSEFFGWVYHLGVNSIGHEYCHLRFLVLRGIYVAMYKRDPNENPGIKPIRKGVISHTLMVKELGRKKVNSGELYVVRFYNRLDETKKGEIACATAGEARNWKEAFDQAKQQAVNDIPTVSHRRNLSIDGELNLEGHRRKVRRYAHDLKRLIKIGKGPEMLLQKTLDLGGGMMINRHSEMDEGDAVGSQDWRCVRTVNGIRIFEDVANSKGSKTFLLKAVAVIGASLDTVFEVVLSLDAQKRHEWDALTGELELLESVDGHYDVVYGTYEPKNLTWWKSKKDFVFSRQWFHGQDGSYTILLSPAVHKKRPHRSGYQRTKVNSSIWELKQLNTPESSSSKCLVTQTLEVNSSIWNRFKGDIGSKFEKTIPYALLCQVAGLKQYLEANPSFASDSPSTYVHSNYSGASIDDADFEDYDLNDDFYDALAKVDSLEDEDSDDDNNDVENKAGRVKLKNIAWAIAGLGLKRSAGALERSELDMHIPSICIDPSQVRSSLHRANGENDTNCWTTPTGRGFMIRGKNYLKDNCKVVGGDPLLKLLAVDFFKDENNLDSIALHPNCLVQIFNSESMRQNLDSRLQLVGILGLSFTQFKLMILLRRL
ncbi:protein ENHANCED DISEASE RESISTANCE 2-like isoform X2 [Asparagus officinalis]|uniref:protein ENHANCED DISEASE RESISTANCE 2-like isoform X2 n=1 Tax=Asparagus officinalis TaxID=4686 RepID=UPI00098E2931|nr:protein ENHANCED DISEASE RESISTANCE 2-like isoform X2 [Asparagus officinalis]